jgi:hypothetical protein
MWQAFVGTDAVAAGTLTRGKLRWNYSALHPRIYVPNGVEQNLFTRAHAAWLWTGGTGVIAGRAAAAFHGSRWVDEDVPIELLAKHGRRHPGMIVRQERVDSDEVTLVAGPPVTSPARTAFDLARHLPRDLAVPHLDALAAATGVTPADVAALADGYPGARGIRRARTAVALIDAGAQSPKESWVRLILLDAGLPKPRTQIRISDGYSTAFIDLGWDEPKIGIDYDGDQHRSDRRQFVRDIGRYDDRTPGLDRSPGCRRAQRDVHRATRARCIRPSRLLAQFDAWVVTGAESQPARRTRRKASAKANKRQSRASRTQAQAALPARTSDAATDPVSSSAVSATSRWSRHAPSTSR